MRAHSQKPCIGITGPDEGGFAAWAAIRFMIWWNGGRARRITPSRPYTDCDLDALVLSGGADIDPSRYKEQLLQTLKQESKRVHKLSWSFFLSIVFWLVRKLLASPSSRGVKDKARDELEFSLLGEAVRARIPVLGICRGCQLINVYWGGSLYQQLDEFYVEQPKLRTMRPRKLVHIEGGSVLSRILEKARAKVNSLHDQSVKDVAKPIKVSARESNGVVQAIEHESYPFMVGVQWHPEFMPYRRDQRRLFHHLVEAAKVHKVGATLPHVLGNFEPRRA